MSELNPFYHPHPNPPPSKGGGNCLLLRVMGQPVKPAPTQLTIAPNQKEFMKTDLKANILINSFVKICVNLPGRSLGRSLVRG